MNDRVAVVGAGPAGSVTALLLARAGVDVDLVDVDDFPRDKACGDVLGVHCVELLHELGLGDVVATGRRVTGEWWLPAERPSVRTDVDPSIRLPVVLPRLRLDAALRDRAIAAGAVPVRTRCVDVGPVGDPGRTLTFAERGGDVVTRRYRYVVGADGARSVVAHRTGAHPGLQDLHAVTIRRYVDLDQAVPPVLLFERGTTDAEHPGPFYCWAFPVDDQCLNVGVYACAPVGRPSLTNRLERFTAALPSHLGSDVTVSESGPVRGGIVRYDFDARRATGEGFTLVGDAAGTGDALLGEGIRHAVLGAIATATTLVEHGFGDTLRDTLVDRMEAELDERVRVSRTNARRMTFTPVADGSEGPSDNE